MLPSNQRNCFRRPVVMLLHWTSDLPGKWPPLMFEITSRFSVTFRSFHSEPIVWYYPLLSWYLLPVVGSLAISKVNIYLLGGIRSWFSSFLQYRHYCNKMMMPLVIQCTNLQCENLRDSIARPFHDLEGYEATITCFPSHTSWITATVWTKGALWFLIGFISTFCAFLFIRAVCKAGMQKIRIKLFVRLQVPSSLWLPIYEVFMTPIFQRHGGS